MFGIAIHGRSGVARAAGEAAAGQGSLARIACAALQALFVGVTILLFGVWLAASTTRRPLLWGLVPGPDCVSYGRGGLRCAASSAGEVSPNASTGDDCVSLGRGGLLCKRPPGSG